MRFLYPADLLKPRRPDETFLPEAAALRAEGFAISVVSLEEAGSGHGEIMPALAEGEPVVYRGWMLDAQDYAALTRRLSEARTRPLTSVPQYLLAHHLPNWYPLLGDLTPETRIFPADIGTDIEQSLRELGWGRHFIKDYVKSLKTSTGAFLDRPEQVASLVEEMRKYRGTVEGGLCVRRVEPFLPDTERRFFVLGGRPFGPDLREDVPTIVHICAQRVASPFFSVDVVRRADGAERVVEIGDGQVSDLVGWSPEGFARMWREWAEEPGLRPHRTPERISP